MHKDRVWGKTSNHELCKVFLVTNAGQELHKPLPSATAHMQRRAIWCFPGKPIVAMSIKWLAGMRGAARKVEQILDPKKANSKGTTWDANEGVGWIKDWSTLVHLFNHKNCTLTSALSSTSKPSFISTQPVTVQQNQDNLYFWAKKAPLEDYIVLHIIYSWLCLSKDNMPMLLLSEFAWPSGWVRKE